MATFNIGSVNFKPKRHLQIRQGKLGSVVVDKETQQEICDVTDITIRCNPDGSVLATIEIELTNPHDILPMEVVDGSVVEATYGKSSVEVAQEYMQKYPTWPVAVEGSISEQITDEKRLLE